MLQRGAEHAAQHRNDEQPHQYARKCAAEMKSTVKKNHRQRKKSKPEMAAHPGLCAADAPSGNAFPGAKQSSKNHESEADDAEHETDNAAAARTSPRFECIEDIHKREKRQNCQRCQCPAALRFVNSHLPGPWPSISAKNVRGSTRCAASCGQA